MKRDLTVIGLGYVGLPLVQEATRSGLSVAGFDINANTINSLWEGRSHVDDLSNDDVGELILLGFEPTTDPSVIAKSRAVVICVPTPLSAEGGPDLAAVHAASRTVAEHLQPGTLVVLESTTYPGCTEEDVKPILETSGLIAGRDFNLAFSPERVDPGNPTYGIRNTPKIVGGFTPRCTERAAELYGQFVDNVVRAKGTREAETAKLLENTYRHVNIALVNEMAKFCHELDIDIWDVIRCAATKPFGYQAFYPGPGVGGHCIPIDPNYLSFKVRAKLGYPFRFVELAQEINAGMPAYVVQRAAELLNEHRKPLKGSTVLLLGVTYKQDIADERESPARPVAANLLARGAEVSYHDPYVVNWRLSERSLPRVPDPVAAAEDADLTILLQPHRSYSNESIARRARLLLDARGATRPSTGTRL